MARIRTIKPEFFRHEALQDLEIEHPGKYPMLVFQGLWVIADREGRFEWRPRRMKLDVLPFLPFDMEETLKILEVSGFIIRYESGIGVFGAILSWERHQIVGRDEPPSEIPAPDGTLTPYFRPLNQTQRFKVYARDKWTCAYCGRDMKNDHRACCLDHVYPYSKGGTNRDTNLVTACKRCNSEKADRTPAEACMPWPSGLGEYLNKETMTLHQCTVNTPLTGGPVVPDKEGEGVKEKEKEGNGVNQAPDEPAPVAVPSGLDLAAWDRWAKYRHDLRKPIKPVSIPAAQRKLAGFGAGQAEAVEQSIANGWQGLFEPKANQRAGPPQSFSRKSVVENYAAQAAQARGDHGKPTDERTIEGTATVVA